MPAAGTSLKCSVFSMCPPARVLSANQDRIHMPTPDKTQTYSRSKRDKGGCSVSPPPPPRRFLLIICEVRKTLDGYRHGNRRGRSRAGPALAHLRPVACRLLRTHRNGRRVTNTPWQALEISSQSLNLIIDLRVVDFNDSSVTLSLE